MSEKSFEDALQQKAKEAKYLNLSELPSELSAVISGEPQFKTDKRGNEALYVQLKTSNPQGVVIQKFGKSLYQKLYEAVKACGGLKALQSEEYTWKQEKAGRAQFNRYFPVSKASVEVAVEKRKK